MHHINHYLLGTSKCALLFTAGSSYKLKTSNDADWAGCLDTRKSPSGWN
ncbi:hypothetical protein A2U01_0050249, partial [Trifolium medium]|nr:hypothetical protein [Trifolium medium]